MVHHVRAIYEDGVLRPIEPLSLADKQEVALTIFDEQDLPPLRFVPPEDFAAYANDSVTMEQVHQAVSKIQGSMADAVIAERNEQF